MSEDLKIWTVTSDDQLTEISKAKLNLEQRLEKWLENNISILSTDLLLIETLYMSLPACEHYKNEEWSGLILQGFFKTESDVATLYKPQKCMSIK